MIEHAENRTVAHMKDTAEKHLGHHNDAVKAMAKDVLVLIEVAGRMDKALNSGDAEDRASALWHWTELEDTF